MKKILWISPLAPYDTVGHAGGKNHNYYLKYVVSQKKFDVKLLSMCTPEELGKLDLDKYGIKNDIFCIPEKGVQNLMKKIVNVESTLNPLNPGHKKLSNYARICFAALIRRNAADVKNADIIVCQWTESLLIYPLLQKYVRKDAKFVAIEEDVSYLGYQRKVLYSGNFLSRLYWKMQYAGLKRKELDLLRRCSLVVTTNQKDLALLKNDGIPENKLFSMIPYYDNYSRVDRDNTDKYMILYYGAMNRKENHSAAIWFVKEVLPLLDERFQFVIIGNKPKENLLKLRSERVIVKGFVKNVSEYFAKCLCMAVPLMLGAGIKIKILEAMSAGIPVLTNNIGIEGIYARDEEEYLHCTTKEEYAAKIQMLCEGKIDGGILGKNAKRFIEDRFNIASAAREFMNHLESLQHESYNRKQE